MGLVALAVAGFSRPAAAQSPRFGVIGFGAFGRIGSVPRAFEPKIPVAIEVSVQWPITGALQLATSADLTVQRIGTTTSFATLNPGLANPLVRRPYSFDVVHFGVGPAFARMLSRRTMVSGSLQGIMLVPSWGSTSVGVCGQTCTELEPSGRTQQTELHFGGAGRVRVTYGERSERIGLELLGIVGPRHSGSRIPLTSLALMLVFGAS